MDLIQSDREHDLSSTASPVPNRGLRCGTSSGISPFQEITCHRETKDCTALSVLAPGLERSAREQPPPSDFKQLSPARCDTPVTPQSSDRPSCSQQDLSLKPLRLPLSDLQKSCWDRSPPTLSASSHRSPKYIQLTKPSGPWSYDRPVDNSKQLAPACFPDFASRYTESDRFFQDFPERPYLRT